MKLIYSCLLVSLIILVLQACKKDGLNDPCEGVDFNISYNKTESISSMNNGSIIVTFPVGDTVTYSLNNGSFQASTNFSNLSPGNYLLTVKNDKGCTDTTGINIPNYGPKYALVEDLITGYCGPCHLYGGNAGGYNFDTDTKIVNAWDKIKATTVDGIPSFMPEGGQLTTVDKNKILDWVNAGHRQLD